jgi:adenine-specific DNA-methyltransferase
MKDVFVRLGVPFEHHKRGIALLGDALSVMRGMKAHSVDLIFADPPYNIGKDFGNDSDRWAETAVYIEWCKEWIRECFRVVKPAGTVYLMNATQHMPYIDVFVSERYHVLSRIVWTYDSSGVQSRKRFGSLYEPILMVILSADQPYTFNESDILIEAKTGALRKLIDYRKTPPQPYNPKKVPGNVWDFPRVRYKMDEYENHPSQKPEALLERVILASSNPEDIVLDPFSGSFTTCSVALRLGRRAIGIELSEVYYKIGLRRMGLAATYLGEALTKDKSRKTCNKSKRDHTAADGNDP